MRSGGANWSARERHRLTRRLEAGKVANSGLDHNSPAVATDPAIFFYQMHSLPKKSSLVPIGYRAEIEAKNKTQVIAMLKSVSSGKRIKDWPLGKAFEHIVLRAFELEGASVRWPFNNAINGTVVEQIDGAVYHGGFAYLVESKDYSDPNNIEPIAKLRNQLTRRPAGTLGLLFARNGFTEPAKTLTRMINPLNILLWEFEELEKGLSTGTHVSSIENQIFLCG